jgi:hypothetical protein
MARQATTRPTFGSNSQVPVSFGGEISPFFDKEIGKTLLGQAPTGTGTISFNPTLGSLTLLKPVSH